MRVPSAVAVLLGTANAQYISTGLAGSCLAGFYFGIRLQNKTYDYVIVGGGTAGLVVAHRLAESPNITVAVVEAGSFYEFGNCNQSQIPFYSTKYVSAYPEDTQPLIDLELVTVPQPRIENNATLLAEATQEYLTNQTGILGLGAGDYIGWENLPQSYRSNLSASTQAYLSTFPSDWPEIKYVVNGNGRTLSDGNTADGTNYATIGILLLSIASNSMLGKPVISVNWLLDEKDQEIAVQAYRRTREIWSRFDPNVKVAPGANVTSYEGILEYVRTRGVGAIHHATSTSNDSMAVVDSHGKVFGVQGLRVIDSSSFAFTPPGHTQGATYGHAEKLVDDIISGR
ncbi:GMC oxidoreductase [Cadophora sp. DSE1049]|nr:GMC oxidoreductase [Cadophora sp. DSE1049]